MREFNPYNHLGFLTTRVSRLIHKRIVDNNSQSPGIPPAYFGILADLWQKDGVTQKDLGTSLIKTKSSITKMLKALSEKDLIYKQDDPLDKRNKLIYLTEKGSQLRFMIEKKGLSAEAHLLSHISDSDLQTTKRVLKELYLNLSKNLYNKIDK